MNSSQPTTIAVMFADVSGSTRLYEQLGDTDALRIINGCLDQLRTAIAKSRGRVIKTIGDEIMASFDSAESAMMAACEIQQRVEALPPFGEVKLAVRVGFHYGPAILENNDVFGDTVNLAARMAGVAKAQQIMTTGETIQSLPPLLRQSAREIDALSIKGKELDVHVWEILWQDDADLTMKTGIPTAAAPVAVALTLRHGGQSYRLDEQNSSISLGRDLNSGIVIRDPSASRTHCKIERRRDKFVLADQSTNGTFVSFDGEAEIALKREEVMLRGRGRFTFGHPDRGASDEGVDFVAD